MCPKPQPWHCIIVLAVLFVVLAVFTIFTSSRPQTQDALEVAEYRGAPEGPGPRRGPLVPSVMMDLYHRGPHEHIAAEIVRSLTPRTVGPAHRRRSEGADPEHLHLVTFDLPAAPPGETLHSAQLRLSLAFLDRGLRPARDVESTVRVYWESAQVLSQRVCGGSSEHVVLNCTQLIGRFHDQHSLGGELQLVVGVAAASGQKVHPMISGDHVDKQPLLLLLYSPSPPTGNDTSAQTQERLQQISEDTSHRHKRDTSAEDYEEETNRIWSGATVKNKQRKSRNLCRRRPLYVEFADIHYDTWIVAPSGYQAYQCAGRCVYPLSDHLTPTKHAIIQTLLHSLQPAKALRSCCVPTKLNSISVLYLDSQGVLTYRLSYRDMVVAECGCR